MILSVFIHTFPYPKSTGKEVNLKRLSISCYILLGRHYSFLHFFCLTRDTPRAIEVHNEHVV